MSNQTKTGHTDKERVAFARKLMERDYLRGFLLLKPTKFDIAVEGDWLLADWRTRVDAAMAHAQEEQA